MAPTEFSGPSRTAMGIDLVSISRVQRLLDEYPERFREFVFAPAERRYCDGRAEPAQHYAARWAVKEAYVKAVGGAGARLELASVEVVHGPPPHLHLSDGAEDLLASAAAARETGLASVDVDVSLAHDVALDSALGAILVRF